MAQTPCVYRQCDESIDYTPSGDVLAGTVVVLGGTLVTIVRIDQVSGRPVGVATEDLWSVPKDTSSVTAGNPLYWDDNGDPVGGTAGSGCFSTNSALGPFGGFAAADALTGDEMVDMILSSVDSGAIPGSFAHMPTATVVVGGTAIANANAVADGFTLVTGADNTAAVRLPAAAAGKVCIIKSGTSGSILKVFPAVADSINGATANAVYNQANLALRTFVAYDATTWYTDPETPT